MRFYFEKKHESNNPILSATKNKQLNGMAWFCFENQTSLSISFPAKFLSTVFLSSGMLMRSSERVAC
jgi:hypothetical protein